MNPDPRLSICQKGQKLIKNFCPNRPWKPGHNPHTQTLEETIAAYTKDAAYAEFQEEKKGQLKVGLWADMVLLSTNIFNIPPEQLAEVEAVLTVCNGRVVYEAKEHSFG